MLIQKCGLMICQGSETSMEETNQQKVAETYGKNRKSLQNQSKEDQLPSQHPRQVFSFKWNCYRNYNQSDKNRCYPYERLSKIQKYDQGIHQCKSTQRFPFNVIQQKKSVQCSLKRFSSPPSQKTQLSIYRTQENMNRKKQDAENSGRLLHKKPSITFTTTNKAYYNQPIDAHRKNLIETQDSSKNMEYNIKQNRLTQNNYLHFLKRSNELHSQQQILKQKSVLKNSSPQQKSKNSTITQKAYPSFDNLQDVEPSAFFGNVKTIKTILTASQLKERSFLQSSRQFTMNNLEEQQHFDPDVQDIKTFKNFARFKKKTAYFRTIQKGNETERTIIDDLNQMKNSMQKQKELAHARLPQKRVHFLFQQKINRDNMDKQKDNDDRTSRQTLQIKNKQVSKCQPSLHNIVQSAQGQKTSLENSIRQMKFPGNYKQNDLKFKHINTIKSIGGESSMSQNSYIDIKFMQSLNSKRAIIKLI